MGFLHGHPSIHPSILAAGGALPTASISSYRCERSVLAPSAPPLVGPTHAAPTTHMQPLAVPLDPRTRFCSAWSRP